MGHRDRPAILQEDAERPQILDCTTRVDRRMARRIRQVYLDPRHGAANDADGFEPNGLLAEQMCDAFERRPLADIPFAEDAGLDHRISQGEAEIREFPFDIFVQDDADRALSQRADCVVS
jgi:hypothetical protein